MWETLPQTTAACRRGRPALLSVTGGQREARCSRCSLVRTVTAVTTLLLVVGMERAAAATLTDADATAATTTIEPRIVNGVATSSHPATGALLLFDDPTASSLYGLCSGTLIGCGTFLTAAHCVCPEGAYTRTACERAGVIKPSLVRVFLQHAGMLRASSIRIAPNYSFARSGDLALITLAEAVNGIAPSAINTTVRPKPGTTGIIAGFGTTSAVPGAPNNSGIKREGVVTTTSCPPDIPDETHICWRFVGNDANTCEGDSGGPLLVDLGPETVVAGVTSGGESQDCLAPDAGFDSDVFANAAWISSSAGADLGTQSCDLPAAGSSSTSVLAKAGTLSATTPAAHFQFDIGDNATLLRVALNTQLIGTTGRVTELNDFDLYLRAEDDPALSTFDCADTNPTGFGFCEVKTPRTGTWKVLVQRERGAGAFQVTVTIFSTFGASTCVGDCDSDGVVSISELLTAVDAALGAGSSQTCRACDANNDGKLTIDELTRAVAFALGGCPRQCN
jgi:hypothetical protein